MLCEEADCLVASLDCLNHVPTGGVVADEVGLAKLGGLSTGLPDCFDDLFELVVLKLRAGVGVFGD